MHVPFKGGAAAGARCRHACRRAGGGSDHACAAQEHLCCRRHLPRVRVEFAKKIHDMTGGDLEDRSAAGGRCRSRRSAFLEAVSKGILDGGHGVLVYHYGKQTALALWGSGPGLRHGRLTCAVLAQLRRRQAGLQKLYASIGANVVCSPMARCRRSRSAGTKTDCQGRGPGRPEVPHRRHLDRRVPRRWVRRSTLCPAAKSWRRWTAACSAIRN